MIKNDIWIKQMADRGMITPFEPRLTREVNKQRVLSFGASSYGYDVRLSPVQFAIFRHIPGHVINPLAFNPDNLESTRLHEDEFGQFFILPSHSYGLATTIERFDMPPTVTGLVTNKSTYVRCGIKMPSTVLEAGWRGHITLELSNSCDEDVRIYANQGIAQVLFFEGTLCSTSYADRAGKYQDQTEKIVLPIG